MTAMRTPRVVDVIKLDDGITPIIYPPIKELRRAFTKGHLLRSIERYERIRLRLMRSINGVGWMATWQRFEKVGLALKAHGWSYEDMKAFLHALSYAKDVSYSNGSVKVTTTCYDEFKRFKGVVVLPGRVEIELRRLRERSEGAKIIVVGN